MTGLPARDLFRRLGQITRGWAIYFRHGASKAAFLALSHHLWHRAWKWLRNKHPKRHWKWIRRRYYPQLRGFPEADGVQLFSPATVTIQRYRYRGTHIPTPWTNRPTKISA